MSIIFQIMKKELETTSHFFLKRLIQFDTTITRSRQNQFLDQFIKSFSVYYKNIWIPEFPNKGSGFRSIRIHDTHLNPTLKQVSDHCKIPSDVWKKIFPKGLIMNINPNDVYYCYNDATYILYNPQQK